MRCARASFQSLDARMTLIAHEILSMALLWSCFCRAVILTRSARRDIRIAFWLLGVTSVWCLFYPLVFPWEPDPVSLALLASIVIVQGVTSFHWKGGIPTAFKRG